MALNELQQTMVNLFEQAYNAQGATGAARTQSAGVPQTSGSVPFSAAIPGEQYRQPGAPVNANEIPREGVADYSKNFKTFEDRIMAAARANPDLNYGQDLMRGSEQRNLNAKTPEETLRLSRLTDALNNQYFRSRYQGGAGVTVGMTGERIGPELSGGNLYQMPFATEEQRQMERMRQYESAIRGREIGRQQTTMDLQVENARNQFEQRLRVDEKLSEEQIRRYMEIWDYVIGYDKLKRTTAFERANTVFATELKSLDIPDRQAQMITKYAMQYPEYANMIAVLFGIGAGAPTQTQILTNRANTQFLNDLFSRGYTDDQAMDALMARNIERIADIMAVEAGVTGNELTQFKSKVVEIFNTGRNR